MKIYTLHMFQDSGPYMSLAFRSKESAGKKRDELVQEATKVAIECCHVMSRGDCDYREVRFQWNQVEKLERMWFDELELEENEHIS